MENILKIAAAPLSWNGREFDVRSKACISLGPIKLEKQFEIALDGKSKEKDGMIV